MLRFLIAEWYENHSQRLYIVNEGIKEYNFRVAPAMVKRWIISVLLSGLLILLPLRLVHIPGVEEVEDLIAGSHEVIDDGHSVIFGKRSFPTVYPDF